jgi:FkbM family methyltransferase
MNPIATIARSCRKGFMLLARKPDRYLQHANGVLHIGANTGQERELYDLFDLPVMWIEPIAEVFQTLQANIVDYPQQRAVQALVTDQDDKEYEFHIASNAGQSSSIFDLKHHSDIWPEVTMEKSVKLNSRRLDTLLAEQSVDMSTFDTLVMDTQGSELLVLQGAGDVLNDIRFIKTEAADFAAYDGCCLLNDLSAFLETRGFVETNRLQIAVRAEGGSYFDVLYRNAGWSG